MPLRIYDSLRREKVDFEPEDPKDVKMYVCGITVYDLPHLGHARTYAAFDVVRRWLDHRGYRVRYVQNVTDIDDKIIERARAHGEAPAEWADKMHQESLKDLDALGIMRPYEMPRVTRHIPHIGWLIELLMEKGYAYQTAEGVYFDLSKWPQHGKLAQVDSSELDREGRKESDPFKRDPRDFALWKRDNLQKSGYNWYRTPWGMEGRPGWHIECSAMVDSIFGSPIDIHGGGMDLKFPHHENEITQSEAAFGKPLSRHWMHTGFLTVQGEKMSKSKGNFITIRDALAKWHPAVIRMWLASTHYRSPLDYSESGLKQAEANMQRLWNAMRDAEEYLVAGDTGGEDRFGADLGFDALRRDFDEAMDDDFNTPLAVAALLQMVGHLNREVRDRASHVTVSHRLAHIRILMDLLGLEGPFESQARTEDGTRVRDDAELVNLLVRLREDARQARNWKLADEIRDGLRRYGVVLTDTAQGPRWSYER